ISTPKNRAETTAAGPAKIANQIIGFSLADLRGDAIHAGLARKSFAKWCGRQFRLCKSEHCSEPAGIKEIKRPSQFGQVSKNQFPAVPECRRRLQWTINSRVVEPRQFKRSIRCLIDYEIVPRRVLAMRDRKCPIFAAVDSDLPD